MMKLDQYTKAQTPEQVRADQERFRSNAGRPHDSRPRRQRSRASSKAAAVRDSRSD